MKILIISHNFFPFIGGIEVTSEIFADHFVRMGHFVKVLTWSQDSSAKFFPYEVIRDPGLKKLFKAHLWADTVFENNPCLRLAWPGFFINKPYVISIHTWICQNRKLSLPNRIKIYRLQNSARVIAASNALKIKTEVSSIVIPNPYRKSLFRILQHVQKVKQYVFLGRLVSDKGADMAIKAVAQLKRILVAEQNYTEVNLTIIGEGPERLSLESLVKELQLESNVHFTGALINEELVLCLNQHKFILIPSVWEEPFGLIALEGMACGCVPIGSDGGGLPEAIGNAGLTFKRGNCDDFINVLRRLWYDSELVESLRDNARSHLNAHHPENVSRRYLEEIGSAFLSYKAQVI